MEELFAQQKTEFDRQIEDVVSAIGTTTTALSRRTGQIEGVVTSQVLLARNKIVSDAEQAFASATHASFEESALMLSPPGPGRKQNGSADVATANRELISDAAFDAVSAFVSTTFPGKYSVELTKKGFRLKHNSRSAQVRRAEAAEMIKTHRKEFTDRFGLYMHYDRTFEYRVVVKNALDFLRVLKSGCPEVEKYAVVSGVCQINEVPIAPASLIPRNNASWDGLVRLLAIQVPGLRSRRVPTSLKDFKGVMYEDVANYFAIAAGVRFLPPVEIATAV
jgi:hypothetical protein